jgi:hypothetical protein
MRFEGRALSSRRFLEDAVSIPTSTGGMQLRVGCGREWGAYQAPAGLSVKGLKIGGLERAWLGSATMHGKWEEKR